MPVIRTGVYPHHMPIIVTSQAHPKWSPLCPTLSCIQNTQIQIFVSKHKTLNTFVTYFKYKKQNTLYVFQIRIWNTYISSSLQHWPSSSMQWLVSHTTRSVAVQPVCRTSLMTVQRIIDFSLFDLGGLPRGYSSPKRTWPTTHLGLPSYEISSPCVNPCWRYQLQNFCGHTNKKQREKTNSNWYIPSMPIGMWG